VFASAKHREDLTLRNERLFFCRKKPPEMGVTSGGGLKEYSFIPDGVKPQPLGVGI